MKYTVHVIQQLKYHDEIIATFDDCSAAVAFMETAVRHCEKATVRLEVTNIEEEEAEE